MSRSCELPSLFICAPRGPINDAFKYGFRQHSLHLLSSTEQGITLPCEYFTSQSISLDRGCFGYESNRGTHGGQGDVVDREMPSDALFVIIEVGCKHLPRGKFHVMGHGPCGVDTVHDDPIECWAHALVDEHLDFSDVSNLEGRFHDRGSVLLR